MAFDVVLSKVIFMWLCVLPKQLLERMKLTRRKRKEIGEMSDEQNNKKKPGAVQPPLNTHTHTHTRVGTDKNLFFSIYNRGLMISIDGSLPLEFSAVCHTSLSLSSI